MTFIDCNASIGTWPLKMPRHSVAPDLGDLYRTEQVTAALVSSVDAVLAADPDDANQRILQEAGSREWMIPVPVLNLRIRNWETLLSNTMEDHAIRTVKLHPSYHGYALDTPAAHRLADVLSSAGMPLMISMRMEDERYQHAAMPVAAVGMQSILDYGERHPDLDIVCLNAYRNEAILAAGQPRIHMDLAFVEMYQTLPDLLGHLEPTRVLFGSHTPFFVIRAAAMKVMWSGVPPDALEAVAHANAERLFGPTAS